ncbi:hypothetical protein IGB42_00032 [Andreprevotia sp. IGB-42]|uniref:hypothetical protein n=1 Tax=Andreprevotia sp. IGB-42 TaxID=2497473 RepID=UPI001359C4E3|nr:hypothetical protein [Andreprevotia sp. IGB-42]KAF0814956.1 hypothetical protein IGB42_00032 [Andreprevotia sp. IGB-42]
MHTHLLQRWPDKLVLVTTVLVFLAHAVALGFAQQQLMQRWAIDISYMGTVLLGTGLGLFRIANARTSRPDR